MEENTRYFSELERFEIININDGEKYNYLSNNDLVIDDEGNFKLLIINNNQSKFSFFNNSEFLEIPWEYVKKIGVRTIIVDIEDNLMKRNKL
ncbi:YlmC/YmxH family sporulation protein [Clostridium frigidicarnis]|uniref:Sporulation protein, YlmC/YmxH family n=1 Tax=Clostridium frigidicarnis TaxID=84698 RepID=A0A1I0WLR3_9CLOT|nr:YlmC/YmxH family sporulation protein [Clostridium frigidicarnis]SFA89494.1 sporulation protein, YlmC/YmxH family [Clostridium frigidicarnis]